MEMGAPGTSGGASWAPWITPPETPGPRHSAALVERLPCAAASEKEAMVDGDNDSTGGSTNPASRRGGAAGGKVTAFAMRQTVWSGLGSSTEWLCVTTGQPLHLSAPQFPHL